MSDIFLSEDLRNLLKKKKVVFIGDSNIRSYYKDMLCLYSNNDIISQRILKAKMENSVFSDRLVRSGEKTNGREYKEERKFTSKLHHFEFFFITRVYSDYVQEILAKITKEGQPDVLIINSCLWDMCRWGPNGVSEYKENLVLLMKELNRIINENCLVLWMTAPPLSANVRGGFLVVQLDFLKYCLRFHVMEANTYCRKVVVAHGYDVLDIHYHLRMQLQRRAADGIHWLPTAVRYITNLILTHISLAWGVPLPHRYESVITQRTLEASEAVDDDEELFSAADNKRKKEEPKKSKNRVGPSCHEFAKREKLKRSRRRIKVWSGEPLYPYSQCRPPLLGMSPGQQFHRSNLSPHQFMQQSFRQFPGNFDFTNSNLPSNCMF